MICTTCESEEADVPYPYGTRACLCTACWAKWGHQIKPVRLTDNCAGDVLETERGSPATAAPFSTVTLCNLGAAYEFYRTSDAHNSGPQR